MQDLLIITGASRRWKISGKPDFIPAGTPYLRSFALHYPDRIFQTPGQIEPSERELYYRLAKDSYRGAGEIVEIGTLVGASSVAFAQGILDNSNVTNKRKRLHSFDTFRFVPSEVFDGAFFSQHGIDLGTDGDFLDAYLQNTAGYEDVIDVTKGDATKAVWSGEPIEILFVDGDKTAEFQEAIIRGFYPHLIPGVSLIVEQDFSFPNAHSIPIKSQIFGKYLQPVEMAGTTMVSRYTAAIPRDELSNPISRLSVRERAAILELMACGIPVATLAQLLRLQRAILLAEGGERREAARALDEIIAKPLTEYAAVNARMARKRL